MSQVKATGFPEDSSTFHCLHMLLENTKWELQMRTNVQVILFFLSLTLSFVLNNPLESDHCNSAILFYVT